MKKKYIPAITTAAVVALLLLYLLLPRSFSHIMGRDFDPAQVDRVGVVLHTMGDEEDLNFTLSPADSQALFDTLSSRSYFPLLGMKDYQYVTLDYQVILSFDYDDYSKYICMEFCGDRDIHIQNAAATRAIRTNGDSEGFQREILDLLLDAEARKR